MAVLLVEDHAVDDDQGLGIGIDAVQALHIHVGPDAGRVVARDGVGVGAKLLLDFLLDVRGTGVLHVAGRALIAQVGLGIVVSGERGGIEHQVALLLALDKSGREHVMRREGYGDGRDEDRHVERKSAVVVGQGRVALYAHSTDDGTGQGLVADGTDDTAGDMTCGIVLPYHNGLLHGLSILLVLGMNGHRQGQQTSSKAKHRQPAAERMIGYDSVEFHVSCV